MGSYLYLSPCWILFIGSQVLKLKSTVKTIMVTATHKTENTKAPTTEGGLLRNLFHQLQQGLTCEIVSLLFLLGERREGSSLFLLSLTEQKGKRVFVSQG